MNALASVAQRSHGVVAIGPRADTRRVEGRGVLKCAKVEVDSGEYRWSPRRHERLFDPAQSSHGGSLLRLKDLTRIE
jgi:hypothetical protein